MRREKAWEGKLGKLRQKEGREPENEKINRNERAMMGCIGIQNIIEGRAHY